MALNLRSTTCNNTVSCGRRLNSGSVLTQNRSHARSTFFQGRVVFNRETNIEFDIHRKGGKLETCC